MAKSKSSGVCSIDKEVYPRKDLITVTRINVDIPHNTSVHKKYADQLEKYGYTTD